VRPDLKGPFAELFEGKKERRKERKKD